MSRAIEEQDFYNFMMDYYDQYDIKEAASFKMAEMNPHIQNMLDRGMYHIVDEVIKNRQDARNE